MLEMGGVLFRLELADGAPAAPPTISVSVPVLRVADSPPLGMRELRVVEVRDVDADQPPVLVVGDV
jgi:hypothetical protein